MAKWNEFRRPNDFMVVNRRPIRSEFLRGTAAWRQRTGTRNRRKSYNRRDTSDRGLSHPAAKLHNLGSFLHQSAPDFFSGMIPIGRYFGIQVHLHWTFLVAMAWVAVLGWRAGGELRDIVEMQGLLVLVFVFVLMHELGHALAARQFQVQTREIVLSPIGGIAYLVGMSRSPWVELVVALAGPMTNLACAALLAIAGGWLGGGIEEEASASPAAWLIEFAIRVNLVLFACNLIPAYPMDGGRVLRALLATKLGYQPATRWAVHLGQLLACLVIGYGVVRGGWVWIALGLAVLVIGYAEQRRCANSAADSNPTPDESPGPNPPF